MKKSWIAYCSLAATLALCSCASQYRIAGNTSVPMLDGKMLYLKTVNAGGARSIDSCEVIHGKFSFMGLMDSTVLAELYMGDESVMPLVIEDGNLKVNINLIDQSVSGGSLNDRLYRFIALKNRLDEQAAEAAMLRRRLVEAGNLPARHTQCDRQAEQIRERVQNLEIAFIKENYDNVLGPGVFMLLCSQFPRPMLTRQIQEIAKDAPPKFLNHPFVRHYMEQANAEVAVRP